MLIHRKHGTPHTNKESFRSWAVGVDEIKLELVADNEHDERVELGMPSLQLIQSEEASALSVFTTLEWKKDTYISRRMPRSRLLVVHGDETPQLVDILGYM